MSASEDMNGALLALLERDQRPPCATGPDPIAEDAEERRAAAYGCQRCSIRQTCANFGDEIKATHGVYGGTDRTRRVGHPAKGAAA